METEELERALAQARRGLRRDVAALLELLDEADLLVPLARRVPGVPLGERMTPNQDGVQLVPHLLEADTGERFAALFSGTEHLGAAERRLGWRTEGGPLEYALLPARLALEVALDILDSRPPEGQQPVVGLVLDGMAPHELLLSRQELASLVAGQPLPLVGYVADIPDDPEEQTLVAELDTPPPAALVAALDARLRDDAELGGYRLAQTFNPERDLEPHLTLYLASSEVLNEDARHALAERTVQAIEDLLPPPGYVDVLFE